MESASRIQLREVACYVCGEGQGTVPYATENGYQLVKCSGCGLLFVNPRPRDEDIAQAQVLGLHKGEASLNVTGRYSRSKARNYLRILRDLYGDELGRRTRTWLDIGSGHGELLEALRNFSGGQVRARGIEPNVAKREAARTRGLDVAVGGLEEEDGTWDAVSLLNVYSHLPDPPAFIGGLRMLLKPGGELLIETGDTANLASRDHFRPFYLPDHLSFASEEIVTGILRRAGFEIVAVRKYPFVQRGWRGLVKETIKLLLPRQQSRLRYWLRPAGLNRTDMYIRCRMG